MEKINFIELATYCANNFKEAHNNENDRYMGTLYVSISEDDQVRCSKTPHVLSGACRCILIHEHSELAVTRYYSWYKIHYIDENGCVFDGNLGNGYELGMIINGSYSNVWMRLTLNNIELYSIKPPFENKIAKVWELFQKVKDISSPKEVKLVADLCRKDERILELEKEVEDFKFENHLLEQQKKQYQGLLDEIKEMVESKSLN